MLLQQLINGLTIGSMYALVAIGYSMVFGVLNIINFAHAEIFMMGTYFGLYLYKTGISPFIAFCIAMVVTAILGILVERIAYKPLRGRSEDPTSSLISSAGMSIMLANLAQVMFSPDIKPFRYPVSSYKLGAITLTDIQILMLVLTTAMVFGLFWVIKNTKIGIASRATSHSIQNAKLMGVNTNSIIRFAFVVGSALACLAGILIGIYFDAVWPGLGQVYGIKAFSAAVLGGIGNLMGALVGGLIIGVIETLGTAYISSGFRNGYAFIILICVLIIKPSGMFVKDTRDKV